MRRRKPSDVAALFDALEARLGLHETIELDYLVDGYSAVLMGGDGTKEIARGEVTGTRAEGEERFDDGYLERDHPRLLDAVENLVAHLPALECRAVGPTSRLPCAGARGHPGQHHATSPAGVRVSW